MRTKPTMRNRMLRSVLVAALSAVVGLGVLGGTSRTGESTRADSHWPAAAQSVTLADSHWPAVVESSTEDSAGS